MRQLITLIFLTIILVQAAAAQSVCELHPSLAEIIRILGGELGIAQQVGRAEADVLRQILLDLDHDEMENWRAELGLNRIYHQMGTVVHEAENVARIQMIVDPEQLTTAMQHIIRQVDRHCAPDALPGAVSDRGDRSGMPGVGDTDQGRRENASEPVPITDRLTHFSILIGALGMLIASVAGVKRLRLMYFNKRFGRRHCMVTGRLLLGETSFFGTIDILGAKGTRFVLAEGSDLGKFDKLVARHPIIVIVDDIAAPAFIFNIEDRIVRMMFEAEMSPSLRAEILAKSVISPFISDEPRGPMDFSGPRHAENARGATKSDDWRLENAQIVSEH